MRVKTQMAPPPTAAISTTNNATAPPLTLLALRVANVVEGEFTSVVVLRRVVDAVDACVVVLAAVVVDVVARAVVVVRAAVVTVVAGFFVVVVVSACASWVVDVSSACCTGSPLPLWLPVWARADRAPDVNAAIAPIVASRRSARRTLG
jgi:hypothetical protein